MADWIEPEDIEQRQRFILGCKASEESLRAEALGHRLRSGELEREADRFAARAAELEVS